MILSPTLVNFNVNSTSSCKNTAILISGRGSNMNSIIQAANQSDFPAKISLVVSNKPDAAGLKSANKFGIPTQILPSKDFDSRESYDKKLNEILEKFNIEIICLAGFMRIVSPWFANKWHGKLINIHPALLPAFKGLNTHQRALEAGVKIHGCTVHFVTAELDAGPIISQAAIPVLHTDDEKSLAARVLEVEHQIYPTALAMLASNKISINSLKTPPISGGDKVDRLIAH